MVLSSTTLSSSVVANALLPTSINWSGVDGKSLKYQREDFDNFFSGTNIGGEWYREVDQSEYNLVYYFYSASTAKGENIYCNSLLKDQEWYSCKSIGEGAFQNNKNIYGSFDLSKWGDWSWLDNLHISANCFASCTNLTSIILPNTKNFYIHDHAFDGCTSLVAVNDDQAGSFYNFTNLKEIGSYGFANCAFTNAYLLYTGLTSIAEGAFENCPKLDTVNFPTGITSIGSNAFKNCIVGKSSATNLDKCTQLVSIGDCAFQNCPFGLGVNYYDLDLSNHSNLTTIGASAFNSCNHLGQVQFTNCTSLASIGNYAFSNDVSLSNVNLQGCTNAFKIGDYAFASCPNLKNFVIDDTTNITEIGNYALQDTPVNFTSLNLPSTIKSIGAYAFNQSHIKQLTFNWTADQLADISMGSYIFNDKNVDTIYIPQGTYDAYTNKLPGWGISDFTKIYEFSPGDVFFNTTTSGNVITQYSSNDKLYTIINGSQIAAHDGLAVTKNNVKSVGAYAFNGNSSIYSGLSFDSTLQSIQTCAFASCTNISSLDLSQCINMNTNGIYPSAFTDCSNLTSINFGTASPVLAISANDFYNCSNLTTCTLPLGLNTIGVNAFANCSKLSSINLLDCGNLIEIDDAAFYSCSNLTIDTFNVPEKLTAIGSRAFVGPKINTLIFNWTNASIVDNLSFALNCFDSDNISQIIIPEGCYEIYANNLNKWGIKKNANVCMDVNASDLFSGDVSGKIMCRYFPDTRKYGIVDAKDLKAPNGLTINNNVQYITSDAFKDNENISGTLHLPSSVATIDGSPFSGCDNINQIQLDANTPSKYYDNGCFAGMNNVTSVIIPYKATTQDYLDNVTKWGLDSSKVYELVDKTCDLVSGDNLSGTMLVQKQITSSNSGYKIINAKSFSFDSLTLSSEVTAIGESAFEDANQHACTITIPNSVTTIEQNAFKNNYFTAIYLDWTSNITRNCGTDCFEPNNTSITDQLYLCAVINTSSWYDDSFLTTIGIKCSRFAGLFEFTLNGNDVFSDQCQATGRFIIDHNSNSDNISIVKATDVVGYNLEFNKYVTQIQTSAFANNKNIKGSLHLSKTITDVQANAFNGCDNINSIFLPNQPSVYQNEAFNGMSSLKYLFTDDAYLSYYTQDEIVRLGMDKSIKIGDENIDAIDLFNSDATGKVACYVNDGDLPSYTIVDGSNVSGNNLIFNKYVIEITEGAFYNNRNIGGSISFTNTITSIGDDAFYGCAFTNISIDDHNSFYQTVQLGKHGVALISKNSSWNNQSVAIGSLACGDIELPKNITQIAANAFSGCAGITSINIPHTINIIGDSPLNDCVGLNSITFNWNVNELHSVHFENDNWLSSCSNLHTIYIPHGTKSAYQTYFNLWHIGDNVQIIEAGSNLGLILGLSLGLGIPALVGISLGIVFGVKKYRKHHPKN